MVKPCENEECGRPFIAKRRDTRFCSASCRARAHTLKNRREHLLARARPGAGGEAAVNTPTTPATARLERRVRGLETALETARVEAVRGLGELAAELRVGRDQAAETVAKLSARFDAEVAAQAKRARAAATEGRRRDARIREIEAQLLRVTTLWGPWSRGSWRWSRRLSWRRRGSEGRESDELAVARVSRPSELAGLVISGVDA
jgi:hypothetical protein